MIKDFDRYVPSFFNRDEKLEAFTDKHDEILQEIEQDIIDFSALRDPVRTPFIDELGEMLSAGILDSDTDRSKRKKVTIAIQGHKNRGLWEEDVKATIDAIVGGDSSIFTLSDDNDPILLAGTKGDPDEYWMTLGADSESDAGIDLIGDESLISAPGIFYIDVDPGSYPGENKVTSDGEQKVTTDDLDKWYSYVNITELVESLLDKVPAYFRIYLGYYIDDEFIELAQIY